MFTICVIPVDKLHWRHFMAQPGHKARLAGLHSILLLFRRYLQLQNLDGDSVGCSVIFAMPKFVLRVETSAGVLHHWMGVRNILILSKINVYSRYIFRVPIIITVLLLIFDSKNAFPNEDKNPNFSYGLAQAIIAVSLLVLCFVGK